MEKFSIKQWVIILILSAIVFFGAGMLVQKELPKTPEQPVVSTQIEIPKSPLLIKVYVAGAVKNPDVYTFEEGSIVKDAILKSGGATSDADLIAINLAKKLEDGEEIIVPFKNSDGSASSADTSGSNNSKKININTASKDALISLPGIGDVKAQAIIDYRNKNGKFKTIEEIVNVSGIGEKTFESLKDLITVN